MAAVRRDLQERLAPVLMMADHQQQQLHLTTLAALAPSLPASLEPTALQLRTPHHVCIDLIPSPSLRDRLIGAGAQTASAFLNEVLCAFVYDVEDREQVVIWGDGHLSEFSWEFSAEGLERWGGWILMDE